MTPPPMANLVVVVVVGLGRAEGRQPARGVVPAQPGHRGGGEMDFHRDGGWSAMGRRRGLPLGRPTTDYISVVSFLTDVQPSSPCLCVVPFSNRCSAETHAEARAELEWADGLEYTEVEMRVPAGHAVFYDVATFHTRLDPPLGVDIAPRRRSMHRYYSRSPAPPRADLCFQLVPPALATIADPKIHTFFGNSTGHQKRWAAVNFDPNFLRENAVRLLARYMERATDDELKGMAAPAAARL